MRERPGAAAPTSSSWRCTGAASTCTSRPPSSGSWPGVLLTGSDIDVLYGHHGHVVQPVQRVHGKWVIYGLGNSVAAQSVRRPATQEGLLVRVQLVRDGKGRWQNGRLDWVPSLVRRASPYRWRDVDLALNKGQLTGSTRRAFERSRLRTKKVVESRGAGRQGAHELAPPPRR